MGIAAVLLGVGLSACGRPAARPDGGFGLLNVGAPAPEVVGKDVGGNEVRLSAQRGHYAVVYFYPQDGSPGCTTEACAFRDVWSRYQTAQVAIIGVSTNSEQSHAAFLRDKQLPFALASDESGSIAAAYGVSRTIFGLDRVTFLVGPDGRVTRVWSNVDPGVHANEVLSAVPSAQ